MEENNLVVPEVEEDGFLVLGWMSLNVFYNEPVMLSFGEQLIIHAIHPSK